MMKTPRCLLATVIAATVGFGALTMAPAAIAESTPSAFLCGTPLGDKEFMSQSDTDLPDVMYVGDAPVTGTKYYGNVTVDASLMNLAYDLMGARSVVGYSDQLITVNGVPREFRVSAPETPIVKGKPMITEAVGDFGTFTPPTEPTLVKIMTGSSYKSHMILKKGNGSVANESDSTCKAKSGKGSLVDTVRVMARSTTTLVLGSDSVGDTDPVEVAAEVTTTGGQASGAVEFTAGDTRISVPVANGEASGVLPVLEVGDYDVVARFVPSDTQLYEGSQSASSRLNVISPASATPTTTTLTVAPGEVERGNPVTLSASVAADEGVPAGNVRFQVAGRTYLEPLVDGTASTTTSDVQVGNHTVTASFVPARPGEFRASSATPQSLKIIPPPAGPGTATTTSMPAFNGPSVFGKLTSAVAYVTPEVGSVKPKGVVRFRVSGYVREVKVVNGRATASLPQLPLGEHEVTAEFVPAGPEFESSSAEGQTLRVIGAPVVAAPVSTATQLEFVGAPKAGQAMSVRARVTGDAQGTVEFNVGWFTQTADVVNGIASVRLPGQAAGTRVVSARFVPSDLTRFTRSADQRSVRVSRTKTVSTVKLVRSGKKLVGKVSVKSSALSTCGSSARVVLTRSGKMLGSRTVSVTCGGKANAVFKGATVTKRAVYTVKVVYRGTSQLARSKASSTARR